MEDGGVVLAVCGGYQLLGTHYSTDQGVIEGLSIVDIYTEQGKDYRLIDNIVLESELSDMPVVGFENHAAELISKIRSHSEKSFMEVEMTDRAATKGSFIKM